MAAFLRLDRRDLVWLLVLVVGAFAIRAAGPISPDILSGNLTHPVAFGGIGTPYNAGGCATVPADSHGRIISAAADGAAHSADQQHCGLVFDEVYFPVDASFDLQTPPRDYFDPEPPLAKLLMAPAIQLLGFGPVSWRITVALAGALFVGLVYVVARRLRDDRWFAVVAATVAAVDGLGIVESRIGVIDMIAITLALAATWVLLLHLGARTSTQWTASLYAFAAVLGLAFGAKLTAIVPALLGVALITARLLEPARHRSAESRMWRDAAGRRVLLHLLAAALLTVTVFGASYARYLTVPHTLTNFNGCTHDSGPFSDPVTPSTTHLNPDIHRNSGAAGMRYLVGDAVGGVWAHTVVSLQYHDDECRGHPYASRWYTWPLQAHPVLMSVDGNHTDSTGTATTGYITNLGNPALWWLGIPALLFCTVAMTRGPGLLRRLGPLALLVAGLVLTIAAFHAAELPQEAKNVIVAPGPLFSVGLVLLLAFGAWTLWCATAGRRLVPAFIVMGYCAAWLMWTLGNEHRVLFSYHLLGGLPFLALAFAYATTALRTATVQIGAATVSLRPLAVAAVALVLAGFVFFLPIWSGAPLSQADFDMRMWFPSWIDGWPS